MLETLQRIKGSAEKESLGLTNRKNTHKFSQSVLTGMGERKPSCDGLSLELLTSVVYFVHRHRWKGKWCKQTS